MPTSDAFRNQMLSRHLLSRHHDIRYPPWTDISESFTVVPSAQNQEIERRVADPQTEAGPQNIIQEVERKVAAPQMQTVEKINDMPEMQTFEEKVPEPQQRRGETTTRARAYKVGSCDQWLSDGLLEKLIEEYKQFNELE